MAKRKSWDQLSTVYRNRLKSNGITKTGFESGVSTRSARGHSSAPESARYRNAVEKSRIDIRTFLPDYDELPTSEREKTARAFIFGVTSKGRGKTNRKTGRRGASVAQVVAKMDFLDIVQEAGESETEFYKLFRSEYANSFSAAA